ncbi:MAG: hypothetical protein KDA36_10605 [Planctomycetaceae bacterium]|nr:hypothetical protein [Planctomycetaceae bacterium]
MVADFPGIKGTLTHAEETIVLSYDVLEHRDISEERRIPRKTATIQWRLEGFLETDFANKDLSDYPLTEKFVVRRQFSPTTAEWKTLLPILQEFIQAGERWHSRNPHPAVP